MAITTRAGFQQALAEGKGIMSPVLGFATGAVTAAAAGSGFFTCQVSWNSIGTTFASTLVGYQYQPTTSAINMACVQLASSAARALYLVRLYRFGTQVLTSTGDQFTRDSWTAPLTRTQFGASAQPLTLTPLILTTTALTVTAAVVTLKTAAGGTGYVDQDGNNVVGTRTFTFPSSTTAIQSAYIMRLEVGDSGVRDIVACQTNTAATAGAASIYGVEWLASIPVGSTSLANVSDHLFGGLDMCDIQPAATTSGSLTQTYLAVLGIGATAAVQPQMIIFGAVA